MAIEHASPTSSRSGIIISQQILMANFGVTVSLPGVYTNDDLTFTVRRLRGSQRRGQAIIKGTIIGCAMYTARKSELLSLFFF